MPPVRRSRRLGTATRTVVEVVVERPAPRPPARSTADRVAAAAETSRGWRARVTERADRAYDAERGRIDWKTVAAELGLPLVGCMHMFDASLSTVAVRQLPGPDDWSMGDERAMVNFVSGNFGTLAGDVWRLAGVYMNASEADCLAAYRRLKHSKITAGVREAIQKYREDGMSWRDIHAIFPVCTSGHLGPMMMLIEHVDAVNQEVQRQHGSGLGVDWAAVSQATYDPDTFCRDTADRMEAFIAKHYQPPVSPNFNAVSNYMWIDINDCIRMAQLLRGEFEWTAEARAMAVKMRRQGMSFEEIARQLSPNLTKNKVSYCVSNTGHRKEHTPLTPEEKQCIRDIVCENAGKMSLCEVVKLVGRSFKGRPAVVGPVHTYAASHPLYKARAERADKDKIARDILSGATTATEAARRLDVPNRLVTAMVAKFQCRMYSSAWTDQETERLLEYIRTNAPPYNWKKFSALLGTKSTYHCHRKVVAMKRSGAIPDKPGG
ncbi:hypothetical protein H4R18_002421 [Coemansia javaensis]|uniref:Myb-like domain-containing protein n=1 Tax=Coemansia javaensis TaxID=2761396 RepID=A0A9W8HC77_9FUNG|nr:hypothetical protein H4R18_002421 [Coemansia javaensis]